MPEKKIKTKIAVLGGGPAGYVASIRASQLGADVVLVEERELGGVCLNRGCIPTKALLKTSEVHQTIKKSKEYGFECSINNFIWETALSRKQKIVNNLRMGLEHLIESKNIKIIKGKGSLISPTEISVASDESNTIISAEKIIITSGSKPLIPNIPGINSDGVITSDEALNISEIPKTLSIIGAGAIGLEFATLFNTLGSKVTIIEMQDRIIPYEDSEISNELLKLLRRQGIAIKTSATVLEITTKESQLEVKYLEREKENKISSEKVLVAIGRKLNTEPENFKNLNLNIQKGVIVVNEHMETNIPGIYAAGDIVGGKLLAHAAFFEGKVAAENALGMKTSIDHAVIPACVYTYPEVASVGLNESEARTQGIDVKIGKFNFRNNGRALTLSERDGFVKVVADQENRIIGCQIIGHNASEMISEMTLAIKLKLKADILADTIHPHPSLSEAIWEACCDITGTSLHKA